MSYDIPGQTRSYNAAGDLSLSFLRFVKLNGATIAAVSAATDKGVGVLQNKPAVAGAAGTVMITGVTRAMSGIALAAGVPVYLDALGRVTSVAVAGQCVGVTETAVTAADLAVSLLLKPLGAVS